MDATHPIDLVEIAEQIRGLPGPGFPPGYAAERFDKLPLLFREQLAVTVAEVCAAAEKKKLSAATVIIAGSLGRGLIAVPSGQLAEKETAEKLHAELTLSCISVRAECVSIATFGARLAKLRKLNDAESAEASAVVRRLDGELIEYLTENGVRPGDPTTVLDHHGRWVAGVFGVILARDIDGNVVSVTFPCGVLTEENKVRIDGETMAAALDPENAEIVVQLAGEDDPHTHTVGDLAWLLDILPYDRHGLENLSSEAVEFVRRALSEDLQPVKHRPGGTVVTNDPSRYDSFEGATRLWCDVRNEGGGSGH